MPPPAPLKHNVLLTIASLLSILLMTFHLTHDIVRGVDPGGPSTLIVVLTLVVAFISHADRTALSLQLPQRSIGFQIDAFRGR